MFGSKRRKLYNYYRRCLPIARNINYKDLPVSLTAKIEELIRNESNRISQPKNLMAILKITKVKEVPDDSASFMTEYLRDPKATLESILALLMSSERTDILLKINDQVDEIIKEYGKRTEDVSNLSEENVNKPDEGELIGSDFESDGAMQETSFSESSSVAFDSITSTNYSKENAQNSLLDKETPKQISSYHSDKKAFHDPEIDDDNCSEFSIDQKEYNSKVKNERRRTALRNKSKIILNGFSEEEYYDDDDGKNILFNKDPEFPDFSIEYSEYSDSCENSDIDSVDHAAMHPEYVVEKDNLQGDIINTGKGLQTLHIIDHQSFSESKSLETFSSQNKLNEKIEEKDKAIRSLHEFENRNLNLAQSIEISDEKLVSSIIDQFFPTSVNYRQTKIFILHSDKNNDVAFGLSKNLNECNFKAIAMEQLPSVWLMNFCHYIRNVVDWADIIIPLITNELLQDIENRDENQISSVNSSNVKYIYNLLQTNYLNSGSINLHLIPVVKEGTSMKFRKHPELRMAKVIWREFSSLCNLISPFHNSTKIQRKIQNDVLLHSCV